MQQARRLAWATAIVLAATLTSSATGQVVITEWMYNGAGEGDTGEYVEFTNIGTSAVDMTGWSFDDSSQIPGTIDLSGFGVVAPGQSVILTDETAQDFAAVWGLTATVIVGGNTANLGRNDEINLYDAGGMLIDRLTYGDEDYPDTPRTRGVSCNIPDTDYAFTTPQTTWVLASIGDAYGSMISTRGEIGSPGCIVGYALSDYDRDGDVDMIDFDKLMCCTTGPFVSYDPQPAECGLTPDALGFIVVDSDQDSDVDLLDFSTYQLCYSGTDIPADPGCGQEAVGPGYTQIILNGDSITIEGDGATADGTTATISLPGTYEISGTLADGQIVVSAALDGLIELILNNVTISNSTSAPMFITQAEFVQIILPEGTTNYLSDATTYVYPDPEDDDPNAALFSKDSMGISGEGSLTVYGNYNDAITSKDDLTISSGNITVVAVDDGIRGKDYLLIEGGNIHVTSGGDALKSDEDEDAELGYIMIEGGTLNIISGGDGITAETVVTVTGDDTDITITSGGGAGTWIPEDLSAKGIKGLVNVIIENGTFDIDAADDGVHSNDNITINGGTLDIATGDDGVHADLTLFINGGDINVTESYEGLESADITINNGNIHVVSSDDGINGAGGVDGSGGGGGWPPPPTGDNFLEINGGYIVVNANGDGIDVNGDITMTGGTVLVHGPTESMNGPLDYDGTFNISGGFLVAAGSSNMAQAPSTSSTQRSVKVTYSSWKSAGTIARIQTNSGLDVVTFAPLKMYRSLVVSSPSFQSGTTYQLYRNGTCTGTYSDGLYQGGTYSGGTLLRTFTTTSSVTSLTAS